MSSLISRRHFLLSSLAYTTSCASSLQNFPFDRQGQFRNLGLQIQFYGVGCFRISFDGQDIPLLFKMIDQTIAKMLPKARYDITMFSFSTALKFFM